MKNIRLTVAQALFMIALFCPFAFADPGDQGSGGFSNTTVVKTSESSLDGDQGSGGLSSPTVVKTSESSLDGDQGSGGRTASTSYVDTILSYFDWLIN